MTQRKLSSAMRRTLEAMVGYESGIDAGSTSAAIEAAGGTRRTLYSAVKKGWADKCGDAKSQGFYSTAMGNVPRYTLTEAGTKALMADNNTFQVGQKVLNVFEDLPAVVRAINETTIDVLYPDAEMLVSGVSAEVFVACTDEEWNAAMKRELAKPGVQQIRKLKGMVV